MYLLYSILYALTLLITSPYWLLGMMRFSKYRAGFRERVGGVPPRLSLPQSGQQSIWIHAVSVGEVLAVGDLIGTLKTHLPEARVFVSTTTLTGQKLARERFGAESVFYLPLDLPFTLNPFLRAIRPVMLIVAETEFWPNLLHLAKASGATTAVVNARISDRSLPGYRRSRGLFRRVLDDIDLFLAQTETDRERLIAIGAGQDRVRVSGNLKFDIKAPAESMLSRQLRRTLASDQRVLVFGSTVEGEEPVLIPCFKSVLTEFPKALIVLAPRHPERFDTVLEMLRGSGLSFWRRSAWNGLPLTGGILLLDTIGELASVYSLADLTFVGGSLLPRGGHNILEPAQFAKPILIGPHFENFREIVRNFLVHEAIRVVTAEELTPMVLELLRTPAQSTRLGARAWSVVEGGRGSTQRTVQALRELLERNIKSTAPVSSPTA